MHLTLPSPICIKFCPPFYGRVCKNAHVFSFFKTRNNSFGDMPLQKMGVPTLSKIAISPQPLGGIQQI